jgi:nitroreductase
MDIVPEIAERVSFKKFNSKSIKKHQLERILKAGHMAPSAKNRQEWRFIVVQDSSTREKIKEASFGQEHVGEAPVIISVCTTNIDYKMPNGQLSYPIDCAIAASYMLLQATREGIGSCCITTFNEERVKHILNVPYTMRVVMMILLGNYDEKPPKRSRKSISRIVSNEHW